MSTVEVPKSKKKGQKNDGINNRLQIVMRCVAEPSLFRHRASRRSPRLAHPSTAETRL